MNIKDKVKIIYSPYSSIKKGTIATITDIKYRNYGKYWTMYILDTIPCRTFRIHEIEKIDTFAEIAEKVLRERHETWKELANK